jgi:hypothetical protein
VSAPLSPERRPEIRARAERAAARPFLFSDCEGVLKVWATSALTHVTRDESGEITGWSEPGSYLAADLVVAVELDMGTWDPGEDVDDDQRRDDLGDMVAAREALPALLAEVERLMAELASQVRYAATLETAICQCEPLCEDGEYLHDADCPVAAIQMDSVHATEAGGSR